jgi:small subunit ribosomal protein S16
MVRIRLRRVGSKKQGSYRVVVTDSRAPRDGRFIEVIGFYDPHTEPETVRIKEDRALYWLSVGAQPSKAVLRFLNTRGTMARLTRLKQGEALEALAAEAEESASAALDDAPKKGASKVPDEKEEPTVEPETDPSEVGAVSEEKADRELART